MSRHMTPEGATGTVDSFCEPRRAGLTLSASVCHQPSTCEIILPSNRSNRPLR